MVNVSEVYLKCIGRLISSWELVVDFENLLLFVNTNLEEVLIFKKHIPHKFYKTLRYTETISHIMEFIVSPLGTDKQKGALGIFKHSNRNTVSCILSTLKCIWKSLELVWINPF